MPINLSNIPNWNTRKFIVKNISANVLTIGDLNITLKKNQSQDLLLLNSFNKKPLRSFEEISNSRDLELAIQLGKVQIYNENGPISSPSEAIKLSDLGSRLPSDLETRLAVLEAQVSLLSNKTLSIGYTEIFPSGVDGSPLDGFEGSIFDFSSTTVSNPEYTYSEDSDSNPDSGTLVGDIGATHTIITFFGYTTTISNHETRLIAPDPRNFPDDYQLMIVGRTDSVLADDGQLEIQAWTNEGDPPGGDLLSYVFTLGTSRLWLIKKSGTWQMIEFVDGLDVGPQI